MGKGGRKCFLFPKFESKTWTMLYVFDETSTNILEITLRVVAHIFRYVEEKYQGHRAIAFSDF